MSKNQIVKIKLLTVMNNFLKLESFPRKFFLKYSFNASYWIAVLKSILVRSSFSISDSTFLIVKSNLGLTRNRQHIKQMFTLVN